METNDHLSGAHRRDLELVLLGAVLAKASREETMAMIPQNFLGKEVGQLVEAMRNGNATPLQNWMSVRSVVPQKSESAIEAVYAALYRDNSRESLRRIAFQVQQHAKLSTTETLIEVLEEALKTAKEIK